MNIHKNARLTPHGRAEVVPQVLEVGRSARRVGREARVAEKTVRKWVSRARTGQPLTEPQLSASSQPARDSAGRRLADRSAAAAAPDVRRVCDGGRR
jgi:transposase-like protein